MREMRLIHRCSVVAAFAMTTLSVPSPAQEQQRNIRSVLFVKVKADRVDDWKAAVKDYAALMKKAGVEQGFTVWSAQTGPDQYAVVWYSAKWKELDQQDPKIKPVEADLARILARLQGASASLETWIDEMQPDLTIRSKETPKMVRTGRMRVAYGKTNEVLAIFKSDTFPALKKAGVEAFGVAIARYGTPSNEIHAYSSFNGWADLDEPYGVQKAMSAEEYKTYQAKLRPIVESIEWTMWRFEPDLSYVPEPKP
ncbi:MAG: hypothetical protein ABSH42_14350 [Bryobacteraceae bacterium]|jgi:hypothetical protein